MSEESKFAVDLSGMIPQLTEEIAAQLRERAIQNFTYETQNAVREEIKKYIAEKIVPEVGKELEKHHDQIRATFAAAIIDGSKAVAEKLNETIKEKISGYDGKEMVQEFYKRILGRGY